MAEPGERRYCTRGGDGRKLSEQYFGTKPMELQYRCSKEQAGCTLRVAEPHHSARHANVWRKRGQGVRCLIIYTGVVCPT